MNGWQSSIHLFAFAVVWVCALAQLILWPTYMAIFWLVLHVIVGAWRALLHSMDGEQGPLHSVFFFIRSIFVFSRKTPWNEQSKENRMRYFDLAYYLLTFAIFHEHFMASRPPMAIAMTGYAALNSTTQGMDAVAGRGTKQFLEENAIFVYSPSLFELPTKSKPVQLVKYTGEKNEFGDTVNDLVYATKKDGRLSTVRCSNDEDRQVTCFLRATKVAVEVSKVPARTHGVSWEGM